MVSEGIQREGGPMSLNPNYYRSFAAHAQ